MQLQSMCPQIGENMPTLHSKRLQMNELTVKPTYGWSNSNGSCNSDEIDHAEACSISSNSEHLRTDWWFRRCITEEVCTSVAPTLQIEDVCQNRIGHRHWQPVSLFVSVLQRHAHGLSQFLVTRAFLLLLKYEIQRELPDDVVHT